MSSLLVILDATGVLVFALSGALLALRKDFDLVGLLTLAAVAGTGGGIIRDVLLGHTPPVAFSEPRYAVAVLIAAALACLTAEAVLRRSRVLLGLDALGLGLFAVVGALSAADAGLGFGYAALVGATVAVGGGAIRDLLAGEVPSILHRDIYAAAAVLGAVVALGLDEIASRPIAGAVAVAAAARTGGAARLEPSRPHPTRSRILMTALATATATSGHERYERALADLEPPFAFVDLDALHRNGTDMLRRAGGTPIRLASKSIRCREVLERILDSDPGPGVVTCLGGGLLASGPADGLRLPTVHHPEGLRLAKPAGAGEVQTPLSGPAADDLRPGDHVYMRQGAATGRGDHGAVRQRPRLEIPPRHQVTGAFGRRNQTNVA